MKKSLRVLTLLILFIFGNIFVYAESVFSYSNDINSKKDLRFLMGNYLVSPYALDKYIEKAAEMGMDEYWRLARVHDISKIVSELEHAHDTNITIAIGLGHLLDSYIDVSTTYSPCQVPNGDFFVNTNPTTGKDNVALNIRTALVGRDEPGNLVEDNYLKSGAILSHSYRLRFPMRVEADWEKLQPDEPIATVLIKSSEPNQKILVKDIIYAKDFNTANQWQNIDIFLKNHGINDKWNPIVIEVYWEGKAGLSLGVIEHQHWDDLEKRTMLESIKEGIMDNNFNYIDDLHEEIMNYNPQLFDNISGFILLDEAPSSWYASWHLVASTVEKHLENLEGFQGRKVFTNYGGLEDPSSSWSGFSNLDEFIKFKASVFSFDDYLFIKGNESHLIPKSGEVLQKRIDNKIKNWTKMVKSAHANGQLCQNFLQIADFESRKLTQEEQSVQAYLSLAIGVDKLAFWSENFVLDGNNINEYGQWLTKLVSEIRDIKPIYDQLKFIDVSGTPNLQGHYVSGIHDLTGQHNSSELRIQVGEFISKNTPYILLVNRHLLKSDILKLNVSLFDEEEDSVSRIIIDEHTGKIIAELKPGEKSFNITILPGKGRLYSIKKKSYIQNTYGEEENDWSVYDTSPSGAIISSIFDEDKGEVIKLEGAGTENGYMLGDWSGGANVWNNRRARTIQWSMKYDEDFVVYVSIDTQKGHRFLYYDNREADGGWISDVISGHDIDSRYVHHGLGKEASDGSWRTFTRDLEEDLKEVEPDNAIVSVNAFHIRGSGLVDDIALLEKSIYEDAEDINTKGWMVYDRVPSEASISNIEDNGNRVIQLQGEGTKNGYILGDWVGGSNVWNNRTEKTIQWSMKYDEDFVVYISVDTEKGERYLYYTNSNNNDGQWKNYIHHGLGESASDGQWRTFSRNLEADLKDLESDNAIISVNAFLIRGSGLVNDIEMFN